MNIDDKIERIWSAVEKTRDTATRIEISLERHMGQQDIHTRTPCESVQTLSNRVWAATGAALIALAGFVLSIVRDRLH